MQGRNMDIRNTKRCELPLVGVQRIKDSLPSDYKAMFSAAFCDMGSIEKCKTAAHDTETKASAKKYTDLTHGVKK